MSTLDLIYNGFIQRISIVNKKDIYRTFFLRLIKSFCFFLLFALVLISLEAVFGFSSFIRKIFYAGFLTFSVASLVFIVLQSFFALKNVTRKKNISEYAQKIGSYFPAIKDNLLNAVQLFSYTKKDKQIFSEELTIESIKQINLISGNFDFTEILSFEFIKRWSLYLFSGFLITLILFITFPSIFSASAYKIINYNYTFIENKLGISFEVKPGHIQIPKGENVEISTKVLFNDPAYNTDYINLYVSELSTDGFELNTVEEKLSSQSTNYFLKNLSNINSNISYWFEYKGIQSTKNKIEIINRPLIKKVKVTVLPPSYTHLPSKEINGTEFTAIFGSTVHVELDASSALSKSAIMFTDGLPIGLVVNDRNASGSFIAKQNGKFRFTIADNKENLTNINSPEYDVKIIQDEFPKISIIEPAPIIEIKNEKDILIRTNISDDFGFYKLKIAYKLSKTKFGQPDKDYRILEIPVKNLDATTLEVPYFLNLSSLNLGTDDEVEYYLEVFDNDNISGPKSSKSSVYKITLPSLESLLNKTEKTKEDIEQSLNSAFEDAMELKKELDELKDKLKKNPDELGINDPTKNQEMQNKIENIQNQFNNTQKKLDDMMNELQNNNQISKETLDKYMELQKMFEQINSQELRDALKKLQEAFQKMSKEMLEEAMKNFKFDEDAFKKALEKTKELLQKILNEQKFGDLTQKLDDITKQQESLKEQTKKTDEKDVNKLNEQSKSQENIQKQYEDFQKQLKELQENMKKLSNDEISKQMEKMLQEMMKKKTEQKMNQSSQSLNQGNQKSSSKQQDEISQDLNDLNQKMQEMLAQMLSNENSKIMQKMQEFLDRLQKMSDKEGELKDKSDKMDKKSDKSEFDENAKEQQNLASELSKTIEEMMSMGQQIGMDPMMSKNLGDAYNEMNNATQNLKEQESKKASKSQGKAKESLDKAIQKMQSNCKNGKVPGKGNSLSQLMQMLQQMIQQQQGLMNQMNQMGINGNQGQLNQEQMAQMQKLAMEQETIKKNLQQLNEEFKKQQEIDGKKLLGDLEQVQKDMSEVIKDMMSGNITPETKKRQEKILSRMLDFQLSAREKDFEKKRESRPGKNFQRESPHEIVISKPRIIDGINQDALEIQKESFFEDYELLIRKYNQKQNSQ